MPAPPWLIDTLAVFGAEAEDREPGLDDEAETDMGVDDKGELDLSDYEPDDPAEYDAPGIRRPFADARRKPREPGIIYGSNRNYWRALSL